MRIVDDDVSWNSIAVVQEKEEEEDEGDMPVVAEFIDERPEEVKLMEEFRSNTKWKLLGEQNEDSQSSDLSVPAKCITRKQRHDSLDDSPPRRLRHDSPDPSPPRQEQCDSPDLSPPRRKRHDSPDLSPPRRKRHDSPDLSPPRRKRHDSPDLSPKKVSSAMGKKAYKATDKSLSGGVQGEQSHLKHSFSDKSLSRQKRNVTPDLSPPRKNKYDSDLESSPPQKKRTGSPTLKKQSGTRGASPATKKLRQIPSPQRCAKHDSDSSSPRRSSRNASDADLSPQRKNRGLGLLRPDSPKRGPLNKNQSKPSDSDSSPPRRTLPAGKEQHGSRSPPDVSPPRRHRDTEESPKKANMMLSGGKAGLLSADVLRREQQELRRQERNNKRLEEESRHSETVFRDKSGRKRDLVKEQLEQKQKADAKSERDEQYAKWGRGLAQGRQQQQNVEDAIKEMQKPLARYIDDQDLDRMLREQEREGDPMAEFIKKRKAKENKDKKEKPRYSGPAPPLNRFNIWPGHRWDGVDRSNGFEQQRFARIASKKAVQELAYKWSVEDM
ncbi:BUD13 [Struthio camelus australis]|uniref:BUD13 homolog n=1 Tax=Struthio camelus australis TaxID=441894 RepID=A0A093HHC4_STRCA|nr:PREDICTED: BUD13 homolog [Struthio camelus australis]KFV78835.1 BUD13 [Struthio camelus australis]